MGSRTKSKHSSTGCTRLEQLGEDLRPFLMLLQNYSLRAKRDPVESFCMSDARDRSSRPSVGDDVQSVVGTWAGCGIHSIIPSETAACSALSSIQHRYRPGASGRPRLYPCNLRRGSCSRNVETREVHHAATALISPRGNLDVAVDRFLLAGHFLRPVHSPTRLLRRRLRTGCCFPFSFVARKSSQRRMECGSGDG
jgi:hypothetical protein